MTPMWLGKKEFGFRMKLFKTFKERSGEKDGPMLRFLRATKAYNRKILVSIKFLFSIAFERHLKVNLICYKLNFQIYFL